MRQLRLAHFLFIGEIEMALIKCIECGKDFSDRAQSCPNCGCPTEVILKEISVSESEKTKEIIATYNIWGYKFEIDATIDKYISFLKAINISRNVFTTNAEKFYVQFKDLDDLMERLPDYFSELLNEMIKIAIDTLNSLEIYDIDSQLFLEKYSSTIDASYLMEPIINRYLEILNMENAIKQYREYLKHARLHSWSGGGFGIRGAIKGYFKAQLLNAGTAFLHSLPDSIKHEQNLSEVTKAKSILLKDENTKTSVINAFLNIYDSCYSSVMNELILAGKIEKCPFDTEKANRIINNINNFMVVANWDETKIKNHLLEAFKADPSRSSVIKMMLLFETTNNIDLKKYALRYGFIPNKKEDNQSKKQETKRAKSKTTNKAPSNYQSTEKQEIIIDDKTKKILLRNQIISSRRSLCYCGGHTLGIRTDGTVLCTHTRYNGYQGDDFYNEGLELENEVKKWENIVLITAVYGCCFGLKPNGTVVIAGHNKKIYNTVTKWNDIVSIASGYNHIIGLKKDGTVIAVGENTENQCKVEKWNDVVSIFADEDITVGIKSNGSVLIAGRTHFNSSWLGSFSFDVSKWRNIVSVAIGSFAIYGLKSDGKIISTGLDSMKISYITDSALKNWKNIIQISVGRDHIVGLKADGTVVALGTTREGQCDVHYWKDIIAVYACNDYTMGLKKDGTVITTNYKKAAKEFDLTYIGECDVEKWINIRVLPEFESVEELFEFESERTVLLEQEYKKRSIRRSQKVCQYCGGTLKGIFIKKCTICGIEKDY